MHRPAELAKQLLVCLTARVAVRPRVDTKRLVRNVTGLDRNILEAREEVSDCKAQQQTQIESSKRTVLATTFAPI